VSSLSPVPSPPSAASADLPAAVPHSVRRAGSWRLLTEPQAGIGPVYRLITGAGSSVDLSMYELADPTAEAHLAADATRGVNVRVVLDQDQEKARNTPAYDYPRRAVRPAPPRTEQLRQSGFRQPAI
jgi:cardiolipin synthase A/B